MQKFQGYYGNEELTLKATDKNGWYKSGDVGYFDENGGLHVHGRVNDMIKLEGQNVILNCFQKLLSIYPFLFIRFMSLKLKAFLKVSKESKEPALLMLYKVKSSLFYVQNCRKRKFLKNFCLKLLLKNFQTLNSKAEFTSLTKSQELIQLATKFTELTQKNLQLS